MLRLKFLQFGAPGGPLPILRCGKASWLQGQAGASFGRSACPAAKDFATSGVSARSLRQKKNPPFGGFFFNHLCWFAPILKIRRTLIWFY